MLFKGIVRAFSLLNEDQYNTIGEFWDEMALEFGLENLQGLGLNWKGNEMDYAIALKTGDISGWNLEIILPDDGWVEVTGKTDQLKELYDEIYKDGALLFEIETFYENGECAVRYFRK